MRVLVCIVVLVIPLFASGCSSGPRPIVAGRDQCTHCRMAITDLRFATQYVTEKGKRFTFDSIECLVRSMHSSDAAIRSAWVADYEMVDTWIPVEQAVYLYSTQIHSPMGENLAAFGPPATVAEIREAYSGKLMTWPEVRAWVQESSVREGRRDAERIVTD